MGISMISLFENNRECEEITVYIIDNNINSENKAKLLSVGEKYERSVKLVPMPDLNELAGVELHTDSRWPLSAFSRLFLDTILPCEIKKVLYLDCDILINDSLEGLYNTELDGYACGGVLDCVSRGHRANIGLTPGDKYINAGMMLISLEKWREDNMSDRFARFIISCGGRPPYYDQGVINGTLSREIMILDLRYNCYTALYDFSYSDLIKYRHPSGYYSENEIAKAVKAPAIVHFTTSFLSLRPWVEGSGHPFAEKWQSFRAMSPWADAPLRKDNRSAERKLAVKIYKAMPQGLSVRIAGALHAHIVPMLRRKR